MWHQLGAILGDQILTDDLALFVNRDFLLKPELLRAISDLGFEHPSEGVLLNIRYNFYGCS